MSTTFDVNKKSQWRALIVPPQTQTVLPIVWVNSVHSGKFCKLHADVLGHSTAQKTE